MSDRPPLNVLPQPVTDMAEITNLAIRGLDRLGGILSSDLLGCQKCAMFGTPSLDVAVL
jgi:hypothetical protein